MKKNLLKSIVILSLLYSGVVLARADSDGTETGNTGELVSYECQGSDTPQNDIKKVTSIHIHSNKLDVKDEYYFVDYSTTIPVSVFDTSYDLTLYTQTIEDNVLSIFERDQTESMGPLVKIDLNTNVGFYRFALFPLACKVIQPIK